MIDSTDTHADDRAAGSVLDCSAIENCQALAFWLNRRHCVIVWRDGPRRLRPVDDGKRLRDLRPGDEVYLHDDEPQTICSFSVYR